MQSLLGVRMAQFQASTQYGDWDGTSAADRSDHLTLNQLLTARNLINAGEFLIAAHLRVGENSQGVDTPYIRVYLYAGSDFDSVQAALAKNLGPINVREVSLALTLGEFLAVFKRFDIVLTVSPLDLIGREYNVIEE